MTVKHNSGAEMWHEYVATYGEYEARGICNRYLDMQIFSKDTEEIQFCKELYSAMQETPITKPHLKTSTDRKDEKPSMLNELVEKRKATQRKNTSNKTHNKQQEMLSL